MFRARCGTIDHIKKMGMTNELSEKLKVEVWNDGLLMRRDKLSFTVSEESTNIVVYDMKLHDFIGMITQELINLNNQVRRLKNKVSVLEEKSTPPRS